VVFDRSGRTRAHASRPTPTHYPRPGWAYYRPEEIWETTAGALSEATGRLGDAATVVGVAVASMAEAAVPLDGSGAPTYDAIAWFDQRTQAQADRLERDFGRDELWRITGLSLQPIFGLCKLLWLKDNEPEAFARTRRWLNMADFIAHRLCGVAATDLSLASRMLALDLKALDWERSLLRTAGISADLFAALQPSGTALGKVTDPAARATGLPTHAIVATGGHDHVCGALATKVVDPGVVLDSMGTAEALFAALKAPLGDPALGAQGYSQGAHVAAGRYYVVGGMYTSGACVDWFRGVVGDADLNRAAAAASPGSLGVFFVPHLRLASPPYDDPSARGAFVGLTTDTTRGALYRAVLEGLAYDFRNALEPLQAQGAVGDRAKVYAIGGSTRNDLFMGIKASVLNRSVEVAGVGEATCLGAAVLAGLGAGVWADVQEALAELAYEHRAVEPEPALAETYEAYFRRVYQHAYPALRSLHHAIHELERRRHAE
jgi:xylulokinase